MEAPESRSEVTDSPRPTKRRHLAVGERQRAVRACYECRRLKEKCEDGVPCRRCRHLQRSCDLNAPPPTTTRRRYSTVADPLRDAVGRMQYMERLIKHHFPDLDLDTESLRRTVASLSIPSPSSQYTLAPRKQDAQPAETDAFDSPGLEDEACTIDNVDGTVTHYSGEFSHWNFSMHVKRNIDDLMIKSNESNLAAVNSVPNFIRVGEAHPDSPFISELIGLLPPRPVAEFLKNVFFRHATGTYFYIERSFVDSMVIQLYKNTGRLGTKDVTAACAVVMVLAVGTQYAHLESSVRSKPERRGGSFETSSGSGWELETGSAFYRQVAKLLSEVIHAGSLLSVQVCLLLGLYSLPVDASGLGYIYLNLAIKLGIQNGMHRKSTRNAFDPDIEEIRRRVWWSAYSLERKIGVYHGRPASIVRSDVDADLPSNGLENSRSQSAFEIVRLLEAIEQTDRTDAFLREILLLRKCRRSEMPEVFARIKQLKANAGGWRPTGAQHAVLPAATKRSEMHSRLDCCLLEMFIGRPFILVHRRNQANDSPGQSRDSDFGPDAGGPGRQSSRQGEFRVASAVWEFLVQDCIAAAEAAIEICHSLQTGPMGLAKSSYVEYSSCRASLLVLIAYSACYRTNQFASALRRGLSAIREMASAGDSARSEVSLIEMLEAALHRLQVFDSEPALPDHSSANEGIQESYEGFAQWYKSRAMSADYTAKPVGSGDLEPAATQASDVSVFGAPDYTGQALSNDVSLGSYPFDFSLSNIGEDTNVFAPDFGNPDASERELLDSLLWIPN